jgi:phosphopantothenoylcysteine decarboxylase/phosphopantothenate--cysteine ligase
MNGRWTSLKNKNILITCGPTWVAIDDLRVISNISSGVMGQTLARDLARAGGKVTLLEGPVRASLRDKRIRVVKFTFFDELKTLLFRELRERSFDIVIHAAAVADYRPAKKQRRKISSQLREWQLKLTPTPKLIERIKKTSPHSFLVGFKLESTSSLSVLKKKTERLRITAGCDLVVANALKDGYRGYILNRDAQQLAEENSRAGLAKALRDILKDRMS